ncbi:unnamed protein product, partial [Porites evermanni]
QNKKSNRTPFAFVITHNPALPNVSTTVRKNINILQSSNRCKQTCPSPPIVAYKRSPILFEVLVRSTLRDFSIQEKPSLDVLKCNHPRCLTSDHSINVVLLIPPELIHSNRDSVRKAREAHLI